MHTHLPVALTLALVLAGLVADRTAADELSVTDAQQALHRAITFFDREVSDQGGYVWRYSSDLTLREGEGEATASVSWVQPPGTPTVGDAFLTAWELTRDQVCLDAALSTGRLLVRGQLQSGGWDYRIETDPEKRTRYRYRVEPFGTRGRNVTTLDDDTTQSALRFLMRLDRALQFEDSGIHEAVRFGLDALIRAQYPNGAWPQRYDEFPDPKAFPVRQASCPETWPRTWPDQNYTGYYTFNDSALADMIDVMFIAADTYDDPRYREAAEGGGDFLLLAQMPEPQPIWAQQYNAEMHPAWARKFEPAAVTGGESQGVLQMLLQLYERTGKEKYLRPVPRAIEFLRASELEDGRLARFYELGTNRPLYFTRSYELTYDADDLPTHYSFIVSSRVDRIERDYQRLRDNPPAETGRRVPRAAVPGKLSRSLAERAAAVVADLDERGAWVERGALRQYPDYGDDQPVIETRTFIRNIETLAEFISASRD